METMRSPSIISATSGDVIPHSCEKRNRRNALKPANPLPNVESGGSLAANGAKVAEVIVEERHDLGERSSFGSEVDDEALNGERLR